MTGKIAEIWIAFVLGGGLWLIGFYGQRISNTHNSEDESLVASGAWSYLFGVRPGKERVYLRVAILQVVGLAYLAFVAVAVWFLDAETVRRVGLASFVLGIFVAGLLWAIQDLLNKLRQ